MVMCCAVASCKNRAKKDSGITFHSFPSDKELLVKWLQAIGREDYKPNDFAKVCSMHFHNDDVYVDKYNRKFIKRGVVPSRFYTVRKLGKNRKIIEEIVPEAANEVIISNAGIEIIDNIKTTAIPNDGQTMDIFPDNSSEESEQNNTKGTGMPPNGLYACQSICDSPPRFQQLKANNISDTKTMKTPFNQFKSNSSRVIIGGHVKRRKCIKRYRKQEIELEDFERINESRLADPKVVKQLLTIAYKTIQEQRTVISSWRRKYKHMEQKVVNLQRALRLLRNEKC